MNKIAAVLSFFFAAVFLTAQPYTDLELIKQAASAFEQHRFDEARDALENVAVKNTEVLTNIAMCYEELKRPGNAVLNLLRARQHAGIGQRLKIRLHLDRIAEKVAGRPVDASPMTRIFDVFRDIAGGISLLVLQLLFLLFWILLFYSGRSPFFHPEWLPQQGKLYRRVSEGLKTVVRPLAGIVCILLGAMLAHHWYESSTTVGVVVKKRAQLLSGPSSSFHSVASLREADVVAIGTTLENYHKVQAQSGTGWVADTSIGVV